MATIDIGNNFKIVENFITPNPYSRPQTKLSKVTKIAIHYVGNPGSTAQNNRDYFNNLATTKATYVSSHFVIGLNGEIIQCIPTNEVAYCTSAANSYSISIETCHPDSTGKFNDITERALIQLTAYLLKLFGLKAPDDIIRHYDVTGKICPMYYVNNPAAYASFKSRVTEIYNSFSTAPEPKLYYKINKTYNNGLWSADQKGAFDYTDKGLGDAIQTYKDMGLGSEYFIFDPYGTVVYPNDEWDEVALFEAEIGKLQSKNRALQNTIDELTSLTSQLIIENTSLQDTQRKLNDSIGFLIDERDSLAAIIKEVHRMTK